ncbi:MAG: helix-turn-helix transcriptional regulator [Cellulomonas sp.]|nr:helix-turn-helix transcriptional regulator [Cellulomonas sp.]
MDGIRTARELGSQLRAERRRAGLTQVDLAERSGVSRPTLRQIEAGHPTGELGKVLAVVTTLGLQMRLEAAPEPTFGLDSFDLDTMPL